jgi:hypothetical protein
MSRPAVRAILARSGSSADRIERARALLAAQIASHQRADVRYWKPVLAELRRLRARDGLWAEGTLVR